MEGILLFNKVFLRLSMCALVAKIQRDKFVRRRRIFGDFWVLHFREPRAARHGFRPAS